MHKRVAIDMIHLYSPNHEAYASLAHIHNGEKRVAIVRRRGTAQRPFYEVSRLSDDEGPKMALASFWTIKDGISFAMAR